MNNENCVQQQALAVPWAGKILHLCLHHANAMCRIAEVIGSPLHVERIISNEKCEGKNDLEEK